MSKKHFIALADAMRDVRLGELPACSIRDAEIISALCHFMRGQNHSFMQGRWLLYLRGECGPSGGKIKRRKEDGDG